MWSIGMYAGPSPFELSPGDDVANPVLSAASVTDVAAAFVADPFMVRSGGLWHMFFEVFVVPDERGVIGWATSTDGREWDYQAIVMAEPFHVSYPYVFESGGMFYMVPETVAAGAVRLYRADPFPERWTHVCDLIEAPGADPSPFVFDGRWWMYVCPRYAEHDALALYCAERLEGPWHEHPKSPLLNSDPRRSRPAGRVLVNEGGIVRLAQDCWPYYGARVRAFVVSRLTPWDYDETARGVLLKPTGSGWNGTGLHHVDAHQLGDGSWLASVDGYSARSLR